jgi:hypothetical protein
MLSKRILVLMFVVAFLLLLVGCFPAPTPPNETPIITSDPITTATVGKAYVYDVNATDPDGDTLTYSLTVKPSGMTIKSATGVISWRPTSGKIGDNPVTVKVSDESLSITQSFIIKVSKPTPTPINHEPVIYSTPITTATVGMLYAYDVNATDPDGDTLTYSLTAFPSGMTISSASGLIMWTPTVKGDYAVVVKASDGALSDTQSFIIVVSKPTPTPINQAPDITSIPSLTAIVGAEYTYTIKATDPEGDAITCSLVSGPTGMTFDGTATISWTPTSLQIGANDVIVKASDGEKATTQSFTITVSETEPEPELVLVGIAVDPDEMILFTGESKAIKSVTATYEIRGAEVPIALGECDYTPDPTGVVTVSNVGLVTAVAAGETTITVAYKGKTDTIDVTVKEPIVIDGTLSPGEWTDYFWFTDNSEGPGTGYDDDSLPIFTGYLYFDETNLYLSFNVEDTTPDTNRDFLYVTLDIPPAMEFNDPIDALYWGSTPDNPSFFGEAYLTSDSFPWDRSQRASTWGTVGGVVTARTITATNRYYELMIPLTAIGASLGDTIGLKIQARDSDYPAFQYVNFFPDMPDGITPIRSDTRVEVEGNFCQVTLIP